MSNQFTYKVPFTESQLHHDYVVCGMSQCEIAAKYSTTQKVVWNAMRRMGIKSRVAAKRNQRRDKNSCWRGGRVLVAQSTRQRLERTEFGNGYFYVLMPDHPNANKSGYVAEHIIVATQAIGRPLLPGEVVHHINLNKHDNRPENLVVCSRTEHATWHNQLEELAVKLLLNHRLIYFDAESGGYNAVRE